MKSRADVASFFDSELIPRIDPLEAERKKVASRVVVLGLVMSVLAALNIFLVINTMINDPEGWLTFLWFILLMGVMAAWMILYGKLTKNYVSSFKDVVIKGIIGFLDPGFVYSPQACISLGEYRESGIFNQRVDRYKGDDLVEGTIGETPFRFSEIHSEYKTESTDSKGRRTTHWHTIFKGLFFRALFAKSFHGKTFVLTDSGKGQNGFFKAIASFFQKLSKSHGQLIKMDNPQFEEYFAVYSNDSIEAHYILSQTLMERMTAYRVKTGKNIVFSFVNNTVFAAIPFVENLFEPRIFHTLYDKSMILRYYDDMSFAFSIVEDLNLNTRLWGHVPAVSMGG